jgi:RNA polymerase sigma-70 factor, ECF subfamily
VRTYDESYVRALAIRDAQAENDLISSFSKAVKVQLWMHLRSSQVVEDACQETFLRIFAYFGTGKTLRTPANLPAFVRCICRNVALEMLRTRSRHLQIQQNMPDPIDCRINPERDSIANEREQTVRRVFKQLSYKDQQLLRRVCVDEEDKDKICEEFEVTRNYLRLLLHRARLRLRALVEDGNLKWPSPGESNRSRSAM